MPMLKWEAQMVLILLNNRYNIKDGYVLQAQYRLKILKMKLKELE